MLHNTDTESQVNIEFHADDFALFPAQSQRILDFHTHGRLNGTSIFPNSPYLDECMALLRPYEDELALTVHLNLIEGQSVCPPEEVPLLVTKEGVFNNSFGGLLFHSLFWKRRAYKEQIKKEFCAQIRAVKQRLEKNGSLRLDGHAHYHMLPVAFDALMELIQEQELDVSYIRIPAEYPMLYIKNWRKLKDISIINFAKVLILNVLAARNERKYASLLQPLQRKLFLGVFLSGRMHRDNVNSILPDAVALAAEKGWDIEILSHPGGVFEAEDAAKITCRPDIAFLTSEYRKKEASLFLHEELRV